MRAKVCWPTSRRWPRREKKLIENLNAALGKMGYRVVLDKEHKRDGNAQETRKASRLREGAGTEDGAGVLMDRFKTRIPQV